MPRTVHKHAHCIDCGYCLYGQSDRCPECGRGFDPTNPLSYSPQPSRRAWFDLAMTVALITLFLFLFAVVFLIMGLP